MNITSKSRYGLKIMMDLAEVALVDESMPLAQRGDIAQRQGIPLDYMDHILSRLRDTGMIASSRGRFGGYRLSQAAETISVLEIFEAVEDTFQPVQCLDGGAGCVVEHSCSSRDAWSEISSAIGRSLSGIILSDLVAKKVSAVRMTANANVACEQTTAGAHECRAPRRRHVSALSAADAKELP